MYKLHILCLYILDLNLESDMTELFILFHYWKGIVRKKVRRYLSNNLPTLLWTSGILYMKGRLGFPIGGNPDWNPESPMAPKHQQNQLVDQQEPFFCFSICLFFLGFVRLGSGVG